MNYDYGDDVVFRMNDAEGKPVEKPGTVVGITVVDNAELAKDLKQPMGAVLYTVEFGDGSDQLVLESSLTPLTDPE
jgi:hypothetical protein